MNRGCYSKQPLAWRHHRPRDGRSWSGTRQTSSGRQSGPKGRSAAAYYYRYQPVRLLATCFSWHYYNNNRLLHPSWPILRPGSYMSRRHSIRRIMSSNGLHHRSVAAWKCMLRFEASLLHWFTEFDFSIINYNYFFFDYWLPIYLCIQFSPLLF